MITRRRSREFHDLVEGRATGQRSSYDDLLDVVGALRAAPAPVAHPAFVAALREQLISEAETVLATAAADRAEVEELDERLRLTPARPGIRRRNRRLAAAITGVVLVGGSATMAVAAQSALPGDPLYSLKRDIESAHAGLTFDRAARGEVLLRSASNRLDEAQALGRTDADPAQVDDALDSFTSQAVGGSDLLIVAYRSSGDEGSVTEVRTFAAASMARLHDLESVVPSASLPQLLQAARAVDQIETVSTQVCPACSGPLVTSTPAVLSGATRLATGAWTTGPPARGRTVRPPRHGHQGPSSGPDLPPIGGTLPSGSVTGPPTPASSPGTVTGTDVQHTIDHVTGGVTGGATGGLTGGSHDGDNDPLGSTATDGTSGALGTVGQAGDAVTGAGEDTVGDLEGDLPSDVSSNLPSLP